MLPGDIGSIGNPFDNSFHVVITDHCASSTVLSGLTITGGNANAQGGVPATGGGVLNQGGSPQFVDCVFTANAANFGAGMYTLDGAAQVTRCRFTANTASTFGGGIVNADGANATFVSCVFRRNSAAYFGGAGMFNNTCQPLIANCTFIANTSGSARYGGGGLRNEKSSPTISNCTILINTAGLGGGIDNFNGSAAVIRNTILFFNSDATGSTEQGQIHNDASTPLFSNSCIQGLTGLLGGLGNFGANPALVDLTGPDHLAGTSDDDLRPQPASPCIDAVNNAAVPADGVDLDADANLVESRPFDLGGTARFRDYVGAADTGSGVAPLVDVGAFEFQPHCLHAGCEDTDIANNDCLVDLSDLVLLLSRYGYNYHLPGDLNYDGHVDLTDLAMMLAAYGTSCN